MSWINPTVPNLADYASFLASVVGIPPAGKAQVFPSAAGSVTAATTTSVTDANQTWTLNQWNGCTLYDSTSNLTAVVTATSPSEVTLSGLNQAPAVGDAYLILQPIVVVSLGIAMRTVNCALNAVDPATYTLAVYNLATDRLINFASDQPGQTFFKDERTKLKISSFAAGVVSSTSDESTSTTLLNPKFMETMTLRDLQNLKTSWGKEYMSMVMDYGSNIWSLV